MPLLWRVFATNAGVLVVATTALALSPATVSFPLAVAELVVLVVGLSAMLALNLALLRRVLAPLERLKRFMRDVDPLHPGGRAAVGHADPEVAELEAAFNDMIERLETERRESARAALAAQEGERARVARELHDEVGQTLTAVLLQLDRTDGPPDEARKAVLRSLEDVRAIARRLRPEALDDLGLPSALASLTVTISRSSGMEIERRIAPGLPDLSPEAELVIYRIAQEALTNVVRHAGARRGVLELAAAGGRVALSIRDDGRGFDPAATGGAGLRGMRERAVLIGGDLRLVSRPGEGTTVRLELP